MKYRLDSPFRYVAAQARRFFAWLLDYRTLVSDREWGHRRAICEKCEFLKDEHCTVCTCPVDAKAYLAMERCPKGKWSRIWRRQKH